MLIVDTLSLHFDEIQICMKLHQHLKRNNLLFDTEDANTYFVKKMGIGEIQNANIVEEFWRLCFSERLINP